MHLAQGDVPQVDEVRLVLGWHEEQLQTVHELPNIVDRRQDIR